MYLEYDVVACSNENP